MANKWLVGVRNSLAEMSMECDSPAGINSKLSGADRSALKTMLKEAMYFIDKRLFT